ncbi:MAG TPA: DUF4038 domain-containing protein [Chitinophagaceae bacterium]|nr:DUF4038 domain-containing protein [Chitinophagaceae bacterium]
MNVVCRLWIRSVVTAFGILLSFGPAGAGQTRPAGAAFPLKLSPNGRWLMDGRGRPFLIREISAWGLIQALPEPEEIAFMDSVKAKGFNTLLVSLISYDTRFAGGPPDWQGIAPFRIHWDFSTYNPLYFDHADRVLRLAEAKGFLVLLVPCYLGYKGDRNQGWWDELLDPHNNPVKSLLYGRFLGNRYKDFPNILWVAGGDNSGKDSLYLHMANIIEGIREFDKSHLWTGHFESAPATVWSTGNPLYSRYMDIDGLYDFTESSLGKDQPQYRAEINQYRKGKMIFQLDQSYEQDIPHTADNEDSTIRRKNYEGLLCGCAGTSFCPGQPANPEYVFKDWRPLMNTVGMREATHCFRLMASIPWYLLVPDTGNKAIIRGKCIYGSRDYICSAMASDRSCYIAYLPRARSITVHLSGIRGKWFRARWYDPRSGREMIIGLLSTALPHVLAPPSRGDWILVAAAAAPPIPHKGI